MIPVEWREDNRNVVVVQIGQIEGVAHFIALELGEACLVYNRIDLITWNELYECRQEGGEGAGSKWVVGFRWSGDTKGRRAGGKRP